MTRLLTIVVIAALLGTPCTAASGLEAPVGTTISAASKKSTSARRQKPDKSLAPSAVAKGSHPIVIRKRATTGTESPRASILLCVVFPATGTGRDVNPRRNRA